MPTGMQNATIFALSEVDPHRDPHGETNGWSTCSKEFSTSSFLRQKRPQSLIYQRLEGFLSLGKDEVGGSNPPSSSKKSCFREKAGLFLRFLVDLICGSGRGAALTHTLTHTRKCAERVKKEQTEKRLLQTDFSLSTAAQNMDCLQVDRQLPVQSTYLRYLRGQRCETAANLAECSPHSAPQ